MYSLPRTEQAARKGCSCCVLWFGNIRAYKGPEFNNVQDANALEQKRIKESFPLRLSSGLVTDMNDAG